MATREYSFPVGSDLIDAAGNGWQIAGIVIDNPSGAWLRVVGIEQYVPPFTLGWSYPLSPSQTNVTIRYTDSASGSLSQLVGGPITVRLMDTPVPSSAGFASGTGAQNPLAPPSSFTRKLVTAGDPSLLAQLELVPAVANQRIVIVSVKLAWTGWYYAWGSFYGYLADNAANPPINIYGILAVTPETPADVLRYSAGSVVMPTNKPLMMYSAVTAGLATETFTVVTEYYYTGE